LNVRSPQTLKSTEITALVPFSTATGVLTTLRLLFARQAKGASQHGLVAFGVD
jgi:hypothetical protein